MNIPDEIFVIKTERNIQDYTLSFTAQDAWRKYFMDALRYKGVTTLSDHMIYNLQQNVTGVEVVRLNAESLKEE